MNEEAFWIAFFLIIIGAVLIGVGVTQYNKAKAAGSGTGGWIAMFVIGIVLVVIGFVVMFFSTRVEQAQIVDEFYDVPYVTVNINGQDVPIRKDLYEQWQSGQLQRFPYPGQYQYTQPPPM